MDQFADSTPRVCQAPSADDMSVLMESVAGEGPVSKIIAVNKVVVIKVLRISNGCSLLY